MKAELEARLMTCRTDPVVIWAGTVSFEEAKRWCFPCQQPWPYEATRPESKLPKQYTPIFSRPSSTVLYRTLDFGSSSLLSSATTESHPQQRRTIVMRLDPRSWRPAAIVAENYMLAFQRYRRPIAHSMLSLRSKTPLETIREYRAYLSFATTILCAVCNQAPLSHGRYTTIVTAFRCSVCVLFTHSSFFPQYCSFHHCSDNVG